MIQFSLDTRSGVSPYLQVVQQVRQAMRLGLSLLPLLIGIGFLFFDGRSVAGWALTAIGAIIILAGIIANLRIYFRATSLFDTLVMLGLLAGGLGLIARSLRASGASADYGSSLG